ncbi:MAG: hypothetical protein NTW86_13380 [Candidatus Sumerlaeota bacterium]|nr:hypothetical protein [Candidatus Sumerlaeota bacterium]
MANPGREERWLFGTHYLVGRMNQALNPAERFGDQRMPADPLPLETFMLGDLGAPIDVAKLDKQFGYLQGLGINLLIVEWWQMRRKGLYFPDGPADYATTIERAAAHGMLVAPFIPRIVLPPEEPLDQYIETLKAQAAEILRIYPRGPLLRLYDREGRPRVAVMLHETPVCKPGEAREYVAAFDRAAEELSAQTGERVAFTMARRKLRLPGPEEFDAWKQGASFLAFYPLIGLSRFYPERADYYQSLQAAGLPLIVGLAPGMHKSENVWEGYNEEFFAKENDLARRCANRRIVVFDIFNGFLEGRGIYPTKQDGDLVPNWVRSVIADLAGPRPETKQTAAHE